MEELIKEIANHYGYESQSRKTCEELAELIQAICKLDNFAGGDIFHAMMDSPRKQLVIEEMADVFIMLNQMMFLLNIQDTILIQEIDKKLKRQLKRMKEEE